MKRMFVTIALAVAVGCSSFTAMADSKLDLLKNAVGGLVEGVFTKSNLTLEDIVGEWTATGSAVCFQDDNFLKKAGGAAISKTIESKIDPYYEKLGLNNAVLTVNSDGTFKLVSKKLTLQGTAASNGDGTFAFTFKALGKVKLGTLKAYVQKSGSHIDVTFDVKKLKNVISAIANYTNISIAKTVSSFLDSYEGLCIGFAMDRTGGDASRDSLFGGSSSSGSSESDSGSSTTTKATDFLKEMMKGLGGSK